MKRVCVTGGTGCIGAPLVRALVKAGCGVRVLDNESRGTVDRLKDIRTEVEYHFGDIRNPRTVRDAFYKMDSVIHLAYVNGTENFYKHPDRVLDVAVKGLVNVMDGCLGAGVYDLLLASSSEVYQTPSVFPTPEDIPLSIPDVLNPRYSYAGGKIISELMALHFGGEDLNRVVVFRPHNVYGPDFSSDHVIPQLIQKSQAISIQGIGGDSVPLHIQGHGQETRSFCYIDDAVSGIMTLFEKGEHRTIYNIGVDEERSIADVARHIARCFGKEIILHTSPAPRGSPARRCPDISKLRALGWEPKVSFHEGIAKTVDWYRNNPPRSGL